MKTVEKFKSQIIEIKFLKNELTKVKTGSVESNSSSKIFSTKSDETVSESSPNSEDNCKAEKNKIELMLQNSLTDLAKIKKEKVLFSVEIASLKKQLNTKVMEAQMPKRQGV